MVLPTREKIGEAKVLMVGAGGIGCELLKNLVLVGFRNIEVIDLDTIELSNLNRQFLFQAKHVGKAKSQVACESVKRFALNLNIVAHQGDITSGEYDDEFFKKFDVVLNALDNRKARSHVNRKCLSVDVPLVESGSSGYLGQVSVIKKGLSECYDCTPKAAQKSFPGCTIRNTPSEPIHCIVWAKHVFNQLFGEPDIDEEVSPDMEDPELQSKENGVAEANENGEKGVQQRVSTRKWAEDGGYDPRMIFDKLFRDDIIYLQKMEKLWEKQKNRRRPIELNWEDLADESAPATNRRKKHAQLKNSR